MNLAGARASLLRNAQLTLWLSISPSSARKIGYEMNEIRWRKSQYSNPNGACVEIGTDGKIVRMRDTQQAHLSNRTVLIFSDTAFREFITKIKEES